jgi:hypothetical protein
MAEIDKQQSLKTLLSIFIALTAVTGALISWQASRVGGAASGADGKAITAALEEAATELGIASETFSNLTDTREFLVHMENARAIHEEYMRNPDVPGHWLDEWQSESIRARARHTQLNTDYVKTQEGRPTFERERFRDTVRALAASEKALDIEPFLKTSEERRRDARLLFSLNALFTAAIFLFTVAMKTDVRRKTIWTSAGVVLYFAATVTAVVKIFG